MEKQREETVDLDRVFEESKLKYYKLLKDGEVKVKISEDVFKCPYCPESREYSYQNLLSHASKIARESQSATLNEKAKHMALEKFTETDLKKQTEEKEVLIHNFNEDMGMMQEKANKVLEKFIIEHEQIKLQLEDHEKKLNEMEKKADDRVLKLVEEHTMEKAKLHEKIKELQKKVDEKKEVNDVDEERKKKFEEEWKEKEDAELANVKAVYGEELYDELARTKAVYGKEVYGGVVAALNEYNPRKRRGSNSKTKKQKKRNEVEDE